MSSGVLAAWGTSPPGPADWRHEAACLAHDAEKWFPIGTTGMAVPQAAEAIAICRTCPVRGQCLKFALDNFIVDGIWGGMSEDERRSFKRRADRAARAAHSEESKTVPAEATLTAIIAFRDAGKSWREIGRLLGTSDGTCREVYNLTRQNVTRATEDRARALVAQAGLVSG